MPNKHTRVIRSICPICEQRGIEHIDYTDAEKNDYYMVAYEHEDSGRICGPTKGFTSQMFINALIKVAEAEKDGKEG